MEPRQVRNTARAVGEEPRNSGLTRDMWESPACRAALFFLLIGSRTRGVLLETCETALNGFIEMFLARRDSQARAPQTTTKRSDAMNRLEALGLPTTYDRRYTTNFSVRFGPLSESVDRRFFLLFFSS